MSLMRGFSLPEVLVAMAISSALLVSASRLLPSLQLAVLRQSQRMLLQEELWQLAFTVGKHVQRAGYCHGQCAGEGLIIADKGQCLIVRWDANNNGVWESAETVGSEVTGFRLRNGALETLRGAASCSAGGWEKISDPALFTIIRFNVQRLETPGYAPRFSISVTAVPVRYSARALTVTRQVTGYNLL